jgi:hypothetical protein
VLNRDKIILFLCSFGTHIIPATTLRIGDWVNPKRRGNEEDISWVYRSTHITSNYLKVEKYTKETIDGLLKKTGLNKVKSPNNDVILVKVLYQDKLGEIFKTC